MTKRQYLKRLVITAVPPHEAREFLNYKVKLMRKENEEFDAYLKEVNALIKKDNKNELQDIEDFINGDGYINLVLPYFRFFRKLFHYEYTAKETYEYILDILEKSKKIYTSEYKIRPDNISSIRTRKNNEVTKYNFILSPIYNDAFFFDLYFNKKTNIAFLDIKTSSKEIADAYNIFIRESKRYGKGSIKRTLFEHSVINASYSALINNGLAEPILLENGNKWLKIDEDKFFEKNSFDIDFIKQYNEQYKAFIDK